MDKKEAQRELRKSQKEYEGICNQLDVLNNEAYELEKYMTQLNAFLRKQGHKCGG